MVDIRVEQEIRLHHHVTRNLDTLPSEYWDKMYINNFYHSFCLNVSIWRYCEYVKIQTCKKLQGIFLHICILEFLL